MDSDSKPEVSTLKFWVLSGCAFASIFGGLYYLYNQEDETENLESEQTESTSHFNTTNSNTPFSENSKEISLKKLSSYLNDKQLSNIQQVIKAIQSNLLNQQHENSLLSKEVLCDIIALIVELADFILHSRNSEYIERRRDNLGTPKYSELCKDYFTIYTFCLTTSRKCVLKLLNIRSKNFKGSIELHSKDEVFYGLINYYKNIFGNMENSKLAVLESKTLGYVFGKYCSKVISSVAEVESFIDEEKRKGKMTEDELNSLYAVKLNYNRLKVSDEMVKVYGFDETQLRYYMVNVHKKEFEESQDYLELVTLLERINGVELIALGFT
mmetsp:Transcript_27842/g.28996  ORF Transcript_27842/g.28996 Transcript_27842/m.28996 type:complete len:326 (+) Transcript_27842:21-998(+)